LLYLNNKKEGLYLLSLKTLKTLKAGIKPVLTGLYGD
jgi:hypothetical protein